MLLFLIVVVLVVLAALRNFGFFGSWCRRWRTVVDNLKCFGQLDSVAHESSDVFADVVVWQVQIRFKTGSECIWADGGENVIEIDFF